MKSSKPYTGRVRRVLFSNDGLHIITAGTYSQVRQHFPGIILKFIGTQGVIVWDRDTNARLPEYQHENGGHVLDAQWFTMDDKFYLVTLHDTGEQVLYPYLGSHTPFGQSQDHAQVHLLEDVMKPFWFGQLSCSETCISSTQSDEVCVRNIKDGTCKYSSLGTPPVCGDNQFHRAQKILL